MGLAACIEWTSSLKPQKKIKKKNKKKFLGRVHVAKQVLAASLWYHASFQRPSEQLLKQLSRQLRKFVASAQQASHSDDALALAQGNSQGSSQLPSAAPGAALFPGELTSHNVTKKKKKKKVLQAGPWHVIALQETHRARNMQGTTACRAVAPELECHRGLVVM